MSQEGLLCDSDACRLCAASAPSGVRLYDADRGGRSVASLVNSYLPLKVKDDGRYPRTICPGCNIQLEATAQFVDLIVEGQSKLREALNRENNFICEDEVAPGNGNESFANNGYYFDYHNASIRVAKSANRKKRGRPPKKKNDPPMEVVEPIKPPEQPIEEGKRRRVPPKRYEGLIQGSELDNIYRDKGLCDDEDRKIPKMNSTSNNEVIGVVFSGKNSCETIIRGKKIPQKRTCEFCSVEFKFGHQFEEHVSICSAAKKDAAPEETQDAVSDTDVDPDPKPDDKLSRMDSTPPILTDNIFTYPSMPDLSSDLLNNQLDQVTKGLGYNISMNIEEEILKVDMSSERMERQLNNDKISSTNPPNKIKKTEDNPNIQRVDKYRYQCLMCDKVYLSRRNCDIHYKAIHQDIRAFQCNDCGMAYKSRTSLVKHITFFHGPKTIQGFPCDFCDKVLKHRSAFLYHRKTVHSGERYVCTKCGKFFKHRQLLVAHQRAHSDSRPFACKVCGVRFKAMSNLKNHEKSHSSEHYVECDFCAKKLGSKHSLITHMRLHTDEKPFSCDVCQKPFRQRSNLNEHVRTHTGEKPFACDICDRRFTTASHLGCHRDRHARNPSHDCLQCEKRFPCRDYLQEHEIAAHGEPPFACTDCSDTFTCQSALRRHAQTHVEKNFVCKACGCTFADLSKLKRHEKKHNGGDQFAKGDSPGEDDGENGALCLIKSEAWKYKSYAGKQAQPTEPIILQTIHEDVKNFGECEFFVDDSGVVIPTQQQTCVIFDQFLNEDGDPIQFTADQDGTHFAVTSTDGKFLQISTEELILSSDANFVQTVDTEQTMSDENNLAQYFSIG